jgi:hypothetical protein
MNLLTFRILILFNLVSTYFLLLIIKDYSLLIFTIQFVLFSLIFMIRIYTVSKSLKETFKYFIPIYGLKYWKYLITDDK